jgi:Flp pilus assembly protein TadG
MALVAPILLVILTGMASFGMALYTQQQLGLAAANAVQAVATGASYITNPCSTAEADAVAGLPANWTVGNISFTLTITMVSSGKTTTQVESWKGTSYPSDCSTTGLTDLTSTPAQFQPLILQISYPYNWFSIMTWTGNGSTFTPSGNLQTTQAAMIQ